MRNIRKQSIPPIFVLIGLFLTLMYATNYTISTIRTFNLNGEELLSIHYHSPEMVEVPAGKIDIVNSAQISEMMAMDILRFI